MEITLALEFSLDIIGQRCEKVVTGDSLYLINRNGTCLHTALDLSIRHNKTYATGGIGVGGYNYFKKS